MSAPRNPKVLPSARPGLDEKLETPDDEFDAWLKTVYDVTQIMQGDYDVWQKAFAYVGFDRNGVLRDLKNKVNDPKTVREVIVLCALRGPNVAAKTKLTNGRTPMDLGIPASGGKGTKFVTCARVTAATADLAAFFLRKLNVPPRSSIPLPGWLQFPAAASIKLPVNYAALHKEFAIEFSKQIGGVFNEQIYTAMRSAAYLDPKLALFEPP
jgi:hypothetical protein